MHADFQSVLCIAVFISLENRAALRIMDEFKKGWFSEISSVWPGQSLSLQVDKILHKERSKFQDIIVFKSKTYGNVLILDGIIQLTEREEHGYHEIMVHVPLFSHPCPKKVLIVGGGDGGAVREIAKHPEVEEIHQCEIDERVIEVSKQFLPTLSSGYSSPKLTIHIEDANKYMERHAGEFDVIITDSCDPIGPAKPLFEKGYFEKIKSALQPGGILCSLGESVYSHLDLIRSSTDSLMELFPVVGYCTSATPAYPTGQCGFILGCKNKNAILSKPLRKLTAQQVKEMGLKYYNSDIHQASFVLPQFAKEALNFSQ